MNTIKRKSGNEMFSNGRKLSEFWRWAYSNVMGNRERGILAEYIVAMATESDADSRIEWDAYDLITPDGIKLEVKSSAYLQTWSQDKLSKIVFNISPSKLWDKKTHTYSTEKIRWADIYVFCLFTATVIDNANPLDLSQWRFFVIRTDELNKKLENQKTITLSGLKLLHHRECNYEDLRQTIFEMNEYC